MRRVFADTFYFVALLNRRDEWHERANQLSADDSIFLVTTDWVLTEVADGFAGTGGRGQALALIRNLRVGRRSHVVRSSPEMWDRGLDLFADRSDKAWSLIDCVSFVVMKQFRITEALTGDHHFTQAGFTPLFVEA